MTYCNTIMEHSTLPRGGFFGEQTLMCTMRQVVSVSPGLSSRFLTGLRSPAARQKTFPLLHFPLYRLRRSRREERFLITYLL